MYLLVIRHAEAIVLGERGISEDEDRPLTDRGHDQCAPIRKALRRLGVRLDRLLTSPLVRARQTAEGIREGWGDGAPLIDECIHLAPGGKKRLLSERLRELEGESIGLVGHNPDLSELIGWFLGDRNIGIDLDKAGLALLEFEGKPAKGAGTLLWLVTPAWCAGLG